MLLLWLPLLWLIATSLNQQINSRLEQRRQARQQAAQQQAEQNRDPHADWFSPQGYSLSPQSVLGVPQRQAVGWPRLNNILPTGGGFGLHGEVYGLSVTPYVEVPKALEDVAASGVLSGLLSPLPGEIGQPVRLKGLLSQETIWAQAATGKWPGTWCAELNLPRAVLGPWRTKEPDARLGEIKLELGGKVWTFPQVLRSGQH